LPRLRASSLGRWLGAGPAGTPRVNLGQTIRERGVTLFSLDSGAPDNAAGMVAGLAVADLTAVCDELTGMSVPGDSLAWINGCEILGQQVLADLVRLGQRAGMAVVLGMGAVGMGFVRAGSLGAGSLGAGSAGSGPVGSGPVGPGLVGAGTVGAGPAGAGSVGAPGGVGSGGVADRLAAEVNVLVAGRSADPALAAAFAGGNGASGPGQIMDGWPGAGPAAPGGFALLAREPRARMLPQCRHVPARQKNTPAAGAPAAPPPQPQPRARP
jgi:hypothetical protein